MAPHYDMKNDVLMRKVHLKARAGPARTVLVPVIPLPFIETVFHYCHADLFSSHSGRTKTIDKVLRHARRLEDQVAVSFAEGDAVWIYQYFRARRGERKTKKLAFSWHGPYRVVGSVGKNAYKVAIPSHPDRVVTVNVNRMKRYQGRMSRPFPSEVPAGIESRTGMDDEGPLTEEDLPTTSFVERVVIGDEETAFTGVSNAIVDVLAKRKLNGEEQYLRRVASLLPDYKVLIDAFEDEERQALVWPELRRSARLVDANAAADEDELLF
ncbi:hypothetical protein PHMEG_00015663 [Phytophthora megakarya]|uniref:Tf2-1-like SH3-like domain-containing protein n=1 Tax=Phytophthora megakarya TaxID=4795 RepID=A0A225W159_9STRA|nr:hypothetical protein PHMEG_00015663 [Phytophthora megakarya]